MMLLASVLELATLVAYVVVIVGGKQKRENGWKVLAFLCGLVGILLCASVSIVVGSHICRLDNFGQICRRIKLTVI